MKAKRVAQGIYRYKDGSFYERPSIGGKRTWRKLWGITIAQAKTELAARRSDHYRSALGLAEDPYQASPSLLQILDAYAAAGFPNARGHVRGERTALDESRRLHRLKQAFGTLKARELTQARLRTFAQKRPARAADLDLYTLRNSIKHALGVGQLDRDPVLQWPRFHVGAQTRHCRDAAPESGDELHALARHLFQRPDSEPSGWWLLLLAFTGCRRSEILELRMDAGEHQPGHVEGQWLWLRRRKGGTNPFALVTPALQACIQAHHAWHARRFPGNPFWIPHRFDKQCHADKDALAHVLRRAAKALKLPHRHPHALRAFYVTVRRSQGASDAQIAAEIGDASGAIIIAQVYGAVPSNWQGREGLDWLPRSSPPAWEALSPTASPAET